MTTVIHWFDVYWRHYDGTSYETRRITSSRPPESLKIGEVFKLKWNGQNHALKVEDIKRYPSDEEPVIYVAYTKLYKSPPRRNSRRFFILKFLIMVDLHVRLLTLLWIF